MQQTPRPSRREFLGALGAGFGAMAAPTFLQAEERNQPRLNVVYINIDDLGWTDVGYKSAYYETPNIDRLASEGMTFTNAYAPAANCAPSRACCMTGQYTPRHGIYTVNSSERGKPEFRKIIPTKNKTTLAEEKITIAEAFHKAGYATCHAGKWHLGKDPRTQGFDVNIGGCEIGGPYKGGYHSPFDFPNCQEKEKGVYLTDRIASDVIEFVKRKQNAPFFLYYAPYAVHAPLQAKRKIKQKYQDKEGNQQHNNATYAAMIETVDANIGRLLDKLDELGISDRTLVLFTSDNGGVYPTSRQWPLRAGKGSYYEGGIREPLIVRWPRRVKPGSSCDVPVHGVDFFPTFLEAAGIPRPEGKTFDGVSLLPLLTGSGEIPDRALFWHFPIYLQGYIANNETRDPLFRTRPGTVMRYGKWKLHEYFEDGAMELYNLDRDVGEKEDLAKQMPNRTLQLHQMMRNWRKKVGAPVPTQLNPAYDPKAEAAAIRKRTDQ